MIATGMALVFGGDPRTAYATAGALKPTHAVTMHGVLFLPALAWLLSFTNGSESRRTRLVWIAAASYFLVIAIVVGTNIAHLILSQKP